MPNLVGEGALSLQGPIHGKNSSAMHAILNMTLEWNLKEEMLECTQCPIVKLGTCQGRFGSILKEGVWLVQWLWRDLDHYCVLLIIDCSPRKDLWKQFDALRISYVTWIKHFINPSWLSWLHVLWWVNEWVVILGLHIDTTHIDYDNCTTYSYLFMRI